MYRYGGPRKPSTPYAYLLDILYIRKRNKGHIGFGLRTFVMAYVLVRQ